eukprot:1184160-Prorocentrum_minimum.AAC.7
MSHHVSKAHLEGAGKVVDGEDDPRGLRVVIVEVVLLEEHHADGGVQAGGEPQHEQQRGEQVHGGTQHLDGGPHRLRVPCRPHHPQDLDLPHRPKGDKIG